MKNNLTTTQKTEVVLAKGKSLLGITAKILSSSKALATATTHKDVTIIGDLMWEKETQNEMNWYEAMEYARNLTLGGYDWRLPTIDELKTIIRECGGINLTLGEDYPKEIIDKNTANESYQANYKAKGFASSCYWSSTTKSNSDPEERASSFGFDSAFRSKNPKHSTNNVRCVKGRKPSKITVAYSYNRELYEALLVVRDKVALKKNIPCYIVFSDKTLKNMATRVPQNKEEMLELYGIGDGKFEKYGEDFLEVLRKYVI